MRVNGTGITQVGDKGASERAKAQTGVTPKATTEEAKNVVVHVAAAEVAALAQRGQAARAERIASVKLRIRDKAYKPDLQKLAERIADEEFAPKVRK